MRKFRNEGITLRTNLIYELGLDHLCTKIIKETNEETAIRWCKEYIQFRNTYGRFPNCNSIDKYEKFLGSWVHSKKYARSGHGRGLFYPILLEIARSSGYPCMFDCSDFEEVAISNYKKVIIFLKNNNRYPSKESKDAEEKQLGIWLSGCRYAKKYPTRKTVSFYPILNELCVQDGYPDMFDSVDDNIKLTKAIKKCNELIKFILEYKRTPIKTSTNEYEKELGTWLSIQKKAKLGKGKYTWFPALDEIAKNNGMHSLFDLSDLQDTQRMESLRNVISYINTHGNYPSGRSNRMCLFLYRMRKSVKGEGKLKDKKIIAMMISVATTAGYPNMFNSNWRDDLRK